MVVIFEVDNIEGDVFHDINDFAIVMLMHVLIPRASSSTLVSSL